VTTPSIADVKAAAERRRIAQSGVAILSDIYTPCPDDYEDRVGWYDMMERQDLELLAEFALSILNAPGLSAERLEEIQRRSASIDVKHGHEAAGTGANNNYARDVPELLTEVLRLRAGLTLPDGAESNHSPIDPNWRSFCKSFDEALARLTKRPDSGDVA
jgi:hypothetical protein